MTPTHTETPLRRSEVGTFRAPGRQSPILNDDEEERRQRRRTVLKLSETSGSSTTEETESLRNCIEICNDNKLSKDKVWSVSVIDTLSKLLEKHHKFLNNFRVVGSSLEASSKVYGLRVDSIHTDVCRLTAGLTKKRFIEKNDNEQNDDQAGKENENNEKQDDGKQKPRRRRKLLSTVTKNKDTINGKLETHPFSDPIFAKLNSVSGSINSSNRLLQNNLPTIDSNILLRMDVPFWDPTPSENNIITDEINYKKYGNLHTVEISVIESLNLQGLSLRPIHTGYVISDTPAEEYDQNDRIINYSPLEDEVNQSQLAVAFDINAEVEPIVDEPPGYMDVDMNELENLSTEERNAITHCKGLRRQPVIIEDMRPTDSKSGNLEYSYRPIDKISQFWAGPSHWKFKKAARKTSINCITVDNNGQNETKKPILNSRSNKPKEKSKLLHEKKLKFQETQDSLFIDLNENFRKKLRLANIQKKWDAKKLRLPSDLQLDLDMFDKFDYMKSYREDRDLIDCTSPDNASESAFNCDNQADEHKESTPEHNENVFENVFENVEPCCSKDVNEKTFDEILPSRTIVEIPTDFADAPDKVTRIVVPFAKRAKAVDMKQLKTCCVHIIKNQFAINSKVDALKEFSDNIEDKDNYLFQKSKYKAGYTTFTKIYKELPKLLTNKMTQALSPSIAFYSVLHLANENNLRLIPQKDLKDFVILQLDL